MKNSKKILMNKLFVSVLLILLQLLLLLVAYSFLKSSVVIARLFRLLSLGVVIFLVAKDEASSYKIIWIVLIFFFPFVGGLLYLFLGNKKPAARLREDFERQNVQMKSDGSHINLLKDIDDDYQGQMYYLNQQNFSLYYGENVTYFSLGDDAFLPMLEAIQQAKKYIFMEYFIVDEGEMFDAVFEILKQKVKEGVEVRFMYDDVGSLTMLPRKFYKQLEKYGIKSVAFNPFVPIVSLVMNNRDHKKIVVVDGEIGFSGGFNLADEYINRKEKYGHWKDSGIMLQGEAVHALTKMFLMTWNAAKHTQEDFSRYLLPQSMNNTKDGYVIPYCDSPLDNERVGENVYLNMINQAHRYLYITTPYLILDDLLQTALINAAKRGVDVRIVTPAIPDKKTVFKVTRSYYRILMENGIRIYEYTPGFMHAQNFLVDDKCATVGTINLDYRSLYLHFENGIFLYRNQCLNDMKQDFMETFEKSHEMSLDEVIQGRFKGLFEDLLRLIAPLL